MQVIPVIDLLGGHVVRGVAGRRHEYRPIASQLVPGSNPADFATAFVRMGLHSIYVADLDAIGGAAPTWDIYRQLLEARADLWIDAGTGDANAAGAIANSQHNGRRVHRIVVGMETLESATALAEIVETIGGERIAFSLDLRGGAPLATSTDWSSLTPLACGERALSMGVRRMIVLDLAGVGMNAGISTLPLCRALRRLDGDLEIIAGGGVRGPDDLTALADAGCNAALVASALHDGRIAPTDASNPPR